MINHKTKFRYSSLLAAVILSQALSAENEAASLPHAAGSFQKTGSSVSGTTKPEHPRSPHINLQHRQ